MLMDPMVYLTGIYSYWDEWAFNGDLTYESLRHSFHPQICEAVDLPLDVFKKTSSATLWSFNIAV